MILRVLLLCFAFIGLDVAAKAFAIHSVPSLLPKLFGYPYGGIPVFEFSGISFSLNTIVNTGAAWGLFQGNSGILFFIRTLIVAGLVGYLLFNRSRSNGFSLWLIISGAIGNGIDYCLYGHVIDFFHFCFWGWSFPIFNLADCYITIGVFCLFLFSRPQKLRTI